MPVVAAVGTTPVLDHYHAPCPIGTLLADGEQLQVYQFGGRRPLALFLQFPLRHGTALRLLIAATYQQRAERSAACGLLIDCSCAATYTGQRATAFAVPRLGSWDGRRYTDRA